MGTTLRRVLPAAALVVLAEAELGGGPMISVALAGSLTLVMLRHVAPTAVLGLLSVTLLVDAALGGELVAGAVTPLIALAWAALVVGSRLPPHVAGLVLAVVTVLVTIANQVADPGAFALLDDLFFFALVVGLPAALGRMLDRRRRMLAMLADASRALAAGRDAAADLARAEETERVRHGLDVALHRRLGTIVDRMGLLFHRGATDATAVPTMLDDVLVEARAALEELRSVVGTLRSPPGPGTSSGAEDETPYRPAREPGGQGPERRPVGWSPSWPSAARAATVLPLAVELTWRDAGKASLVPLAAGVALCVAAGMLLWVLPRAPVRVVLALQVLIVAYSVSVTPLSELVTSLLPLVATAFSLGAAAPLLRSLAGLGLALAGTGVDVYLAPVATQDLGSLLPTLVIELVAWLAGREARRRHLRIGELARLNQALARSRDTRARLSAARTRLELARDLHDAGAHSLTALCLQAGAAQRLWEVDPEGAEHALQTLQVVTRDLDRLRTSLDGLDARPPPESAALLTQWRGVGRRLGLEVEWDLEPEAVALIGGARVPAATAEVLHSIVREALTNVARHAPGAQPRVRLGRVDGAIRLEVLDTGSAGGRVPRLPDRDSGTGTGLVGLRERVESLGGDLTYAPCAHGGFRVLATLTAPSALTSGPSGAGAS